MKVERIERDKTSKLKHRRVKSRDGLLFYLHTSCMTRASQHGRPTATVEFNTHIHKHTKRCIIHAHKKPIEKNSGRFLHVKNHRFIGRIVKNWRVSENSEREAALTLRVRPLLSIMAQKIVLFVHWCLARWCSNRFRDYFVPVNCHHTRECSQQLLVVTFWSGPHGQATIQFHCDPTWNALPLALCM